MSAEQRQCRDCGTLLERFIHPTDPDRTERPGKFAGRLCCWDCRRKAKGTFLRQGGWPQVTGEIKASFHQHNIDPGEERGYLPSRPATVITKASVLA